MSGSKKRTPLCSIPLDDVLLSYYHSTTAAATNVLASLSSLINAATILLPPSPFRRRRRSRLRLRFRCGNTVYIGHRHSGGDVDIIITLYVAAEGGGGLRPKRPPPLHLLSLPFPSDSAINGRTCRVWTLANTDPGRLWPAVCIA